MAEWIADRDSSSSVATTWNVRASLVNEWLWALLVRPSEEGYPIRQALFATDPGLVKRIEEFWGDGEREFIELVVLAKRSGCLWETDPDRLLAAIGSVLDSGEGSETFDSETPQVAATMRQRLGRLAREPSLAGDWLALVAAVAALVGPSWDAEGCLAVHMAVRAQSQAAARDPGWPEVTLEPGCDWRDAVPNLARRAIAAGGEAVVVPCWLARRNLLLSFGDLVMLGVSAPRPSLPSETTRTVARRLRALADPTRLALVEQLAIRPRGVGELARDLQMSQPTISNHVRLLREAGVIRDGERPHQRRLTVDSRDLDGLLEEVRASVFGGLAGG